MQWFSILSIFFITLPPTLQLLCGIFGNVLSTYLRNLHNFKIWRPVQLSNLVSNVRASNVRVYRPVQLLQHAPVSLTKLISEFIPVQN